MSGRRYRTITAKPGELRAAFGRDDARGNSPDIMYAWGGGGSSSPDGRVLSNAFEEAIVFDGKPLRKVLEERGYDITTLRFTIQQKR